MGETDVGEGSAADRAERSRMRRRLVDIFMDFRPLFENFDQADRDKLVDRDPWERAELHDGMVAAIALFYEMCEREGWAFEDLLERAVENVYSTGKRSPDPMTVEDVSYEESLAPIRLHQRKDIERAALLKFKRGHKLTDREYRILTEPKGWIIDPETNLYISREEILETLRERRKERAREEKRNDMLDRVEVDSEMFGDYYQIPPDLREEFEDEIDE